MIKTLLREKLRHPWLRPLLLLLLALAASASPASAITFTVGQLTYNTDYSRDGEANLYDANRSLSSHIEIPATVVYEGRSYNVTRIGYGVFYLTTVTSISIPASVREIDVSAFHTGYGTLSSIEVDPENQYFSSIDGVLYNKEITKLLKFPAGKASFEMPESVTIIGSSAFSYCRNLTSLSLSANLKEINSGAFTGSTFKPLKILSKEAIEFNAEEAFHGINVGSEIACYSANYDFINGATQQIPVYKIDVPDVRITEVTPYLCGATFKIGNPYYEGNLDDYSFVLTDPIDPDDPRIPVYTGRLNTITGLKVNKGYSLYVGRLSGSREIQCDHSDFATKEPKVRRISYDRTQTTITLNSVDCESDITCTPKITIQGEEFTGKPIKLAGLKPNTTVKVWTEYPGYTTTNDASTSDIYVHATSVGDVFPNQLEFKGTYNVGDAKLKNIEWQHKINGFETVGTDKDLIFTGLRPNTEYELYFTVNVSCDDGSTYTKKAYIEKKTAARLELEMQAPKSVGGGKAIVSATTNLSETEANVGFEWKKYDAPESLPYSRGFSAICDGSVEGLIKNLQDTYYTVRAFYQDRWGNFFYSPVTTFDPTDFSYFEPTVRTYPAETGAGLTTLHGYALGGTDDITSQGFEYWILSPGASAPGRTGAPAAGADVKTVRAEGQRMSVVLTDLRAATTYAYRAFVETSSGLTYGEEMSFETPVVDGIEDVAVEDAEATVVGYYDLNGRRYDTLQRGFNIVVYSDGRTKKVMGK